MRPQKVVFCVLSRFFYDVYWLVIAYIDVHDACLSYMGHLCKYQVQCGGRVTCLSGWVFNVLLQVEVLCGVFQFLCGWIVWTVVSIHVS